ncbi:MAG: signal recognition particle protein Srp19 [Methanocellales archaeon]
MERSRKIVIWPANLDSSKSRREGRAIPKQLAVLTPKLEEIELAARELNLNPEREAQKAYPKSWWERTGLIKVDKIAPKTQIIRQIAQKITEIRARAAVQKPKK